MDGRSHLLSLEIADHAYVLDDGAVVYSGSASELAADEARVQALARRQRRGMDDCLAGILQHLQQRFAEVPSLECQ